MNKILIKFELLNTIFFILIDFQLSPNASELKSNKLFLAKLEE